MCRDEQAREDSVKPPRVVRDLDSADGMTGGAAQYRPSGAVEWVWHALVLYFYVVPGGTRRRAFLDFFL